MTEYALRNSDPQAEQRMGALEELFDPPTTEYLDRLGVTEGWSCWEVGAGSGSIARWLARKVGITGSVLATDLDTRWLSDANLPRLSASVHDVVTDRTPEDAFDLVHARLVLVHLRERGRVLSSLVRSLRPGGWIVIEDFDQVLSQTRQRTTIGAPSVRRLQDALAAFLSKRGADLAYARRLPDLLRDAGLRDVGGEGRMTFAPGGSPASRLMKANFLQVGDDLVQAGLCTLPQLDAGLERLDDPSSGLATSMMVSAWGRRPTSDGVAGRSR